MNRGYRFIAFDLGAESGRTIFGQLDGQRFDYQEVHRFPTQNDTILGVRQWDAAYIYREILTGLAQCVKEHGPQVDGIAIDTWGVDFGLLDRDGTLLTNPGHYRDARTEGMQEAAFEIVPAEQFYRHSGLGVNRFDTLFQLMGLARTQPALLEAAQTFVMIGDLFHYFLTGKTSCEYTNATTTQLIDPRSGQWNWELIERFGLPKRIFKPITQPGSLVGALLPEIARQVGLSPQTPVFTPVTHDTASVIAATPVLQDAGPWAYISCGTWSIMGAELDEPLINERSHALGFSNEGGAEGKTCFHKTPIGLWLVQECRREWARQDGTETGYDQLTREAMQAEPFAAIIDVDDPRLYAPEDMPQTIRQICRENGQSEPKTRGAFVRCALESMALKFRLTLREMDSILERKTACIHMMGGGVKNRLLCQLTADACGVPVWAGPIEAAILGNLAMQAKAAGVLNSLAQARQIIRNSAELEHFEPVTTAPWDEIETKLTGKLALSRS